LTSSEYSKHRRRDKVKAAVEVEVEVGVVEVKAGVVEVKVRVVTKEPGAAKVLGTRDQGDCRARAGIEVGQELRSGRN
jgi:hypothetical protein